MKAREKIIIGRTDRADFPLLDLLEIDVKVDTGAYSSSIHCHDLEEVEENGLKTLNFRLLDPGHDAYNHRLYKLKDYSIKNVKSSNGSVQERFFIRTDIILFNNRYSIDLSLAERGEMRYPVLLGRKLLKGRFLVDCAKNMLSWRARPR